MLVNFAEKYYKYFAVLILLFCAYNFIGLNAGVNDYIDANGINFYSLFTSGVDLSSSAGLNDIVAWFDSWRIDSDKWYSFLNIFNGAFKTSAVIGAVMVDAVSIVVKLIALVLGV